MNLTIDEKKETKKKITKASEKPEEAHEAKRVMKKAMNKIEKQKKIVEKDKVQIVVHLTDVLHELEMNAETLGWISRKSKEMPLGKKFIHRNVIIVVILIVILGLFRCIKWYVCDS